ncbi:hypothetical protein [Streptomyces sp. NPDC058874]
MHPGTLGRSPTKDLRIEVRVDGGEDPALEFVGFEDFDFPLHGAVGVEA